MNKKYIKISALWFALLMVPAAAQAGIVFDNAWKSNASDAGAFSQANQILAGGFSLGAGSSVNRATWHGSMFSADPLNTGDTWNFNVVFRNNNAGTPGSVMSSRSVVASVIDTGLNISGERAYLFDASFADTFLAGSTSYFLDIINTGTQNTFRWNVGLDSAYTGFFSGNGGASWNNLGSRAPLSFSLYSGAAQVPEPATLGLLGLGLLGLGFVRKTNKNK